MVSSILTNNGALTALQSLKATQKSLLSTQNRISTGMKVATAKDNAATWAVATAMRSDIANTKQVSENLSVSSSIVATASAAAETISDLVKQIRTKVTSAQNPAVDKAQVQADIDGYLAQIGTTVNAASFKGVNLVNGDGTQRVLTSVNSVNGVSTAAYADVAKQDLSVAKGSLLEGLKDLTVLSRADQTLANLNDGVQKITLTTSGTLALKAGNELAMKYIDESGTDRTLTVKITKDISTVANLLTYLNDDSGFKANFTADASVAAGVTSTTDFTISAKNRDSVIKLGSNSGTTAVALTSVLKAQAGANGVALQTAALGTGNTNGLGGGVSVASMTFADKPLVEGDEFVLKVDLTPATATTDKGDITYKLKVVGGTYATGDMISDGSDPANRVFTIAVAAADVTNPNVTGKNIAEKLRDALVTGTGSTKWNIAAITNPTALAGGPFVNAAATAGTNFSAQVDDISGALTIKSGDGTDSVVGFNSSKTDYDVLLSKLDSAGSAVTNAAAAFGTAATRIDLQKDFLDKLVDTLNTGLGALVDADMSEEAARLQALQVQEQLGTQALSIANQAPQSILRLFQ